MEEEAVFFDMFMLRAVMGKELFNSNSAALNKFNNNNRNNATKEMEVYYYEFIDLMRELVYETDVNKYDKIINRVQFEIDRVESMKSEPSEQTAFFGESGMTQQGVIPNVRTVSNNEVTSRLKQLRNENSQPNRPPSSKRPRVRGPVWFGEKEGMDES